MKFPKIRPFSRAGTTPDVLLELRKRDANERQILQLAHSVARAIRFVWRSARQSCLVVECDRGVVGMGRSPIHGEGGQPEWSITEKLARVTNSVAEFVPATWEPQNAYEEHFGGVYGMAGLRLPGRAEKTGFEVPKFARKLQVRNCHAIGEKLTLVFISTHYFCAPLEDVVDGPRHLSNSTDPKGLGITMTRKIRGSFLPTHPSSYTTLKKYRFDIPPGLEHNQTDWAKVISAVQDALTQKRLKIKKARSVYLKHPGPKFWDKLDERLAKIRKEAKSDAKITK
ncbi:hypothetical protein C8J57DRAFT_1255492 [Mycena rebaudengoi]|nr:hypothetical protein C8J57DRAFT_1255492 [Mycena rebaudengoi]